MLSTILIAITALALALISEALLEATKCRQSMDDHGIRWRGRHCAGRHQPAGLYEWP
jgi:hypothetical protein